MLEMLRSLGKNAYIKSLEIFLITNVMNHVLSGEPCNFTIGKEGIVLNYSHDELYDIYSDRYLWAKRDGGEKFVKFIEKFDEFNVTYNQNKEMLRSLMNPK